MSSASSLLNPSSLKKESSTRELASITCSSTLTRFS
jgi:hypothetical protein